MRALHAEGVSLSEIGRRLGCSRRLVRRYVHADAFPERRPHRRPPSRLDPFLPYLHQRWAEGRRITLQLWRELRERGYPGSRKRVTQWVQQRREEPAPTMPGRHRLAGTREHGANGDRRGRLMGANNGPALVDLLAGARAGKRGLAGQVQPGLSGPR